MNELEPRHAQNENPLPSRSPSNLLGSYCPTSTTPTHYCPGPWPHPPSPFESLQLLPCCGTLGRWLHLVLGISVINWDKGESFCHDLLPASFSLSLSNTEVNLLKSYGPWAERPFLSLTSKTAECMFRELMYFPFRLVQIHRHCLLVITKTGHNLWEYLNLQ